MRKKGCVDRVLQREGNCRSPILLSLTLASVATLVLAFNLDENQTKLAQVSFIASMVLNSVLMFCLVKPYCDQHEKDVADFGVSIVFQDAYLLTKNPPRHYGLFSVQSNLLHNLDETELQDDGVKPDNETLGIHSHEL